MQVSNEDLKKLYRELLENQRYQAVINDLKNFVGWGKLSYEPGMSFEEVAYNEGLKAVVGYMLTALEDMPTNPEPMEHNDD